MQAKKYELSPKPLNPYNFNKHYQNILLFACNSLSLDYEFLQSNSKVILYFIIHIFGMRELGIWLWKKKSKVIIF